MSQWYVAHILMYVKRKKIGAVKIPVWENLVLIKADSEDEAFAKAQARGKQDEGDDAGTFRWAGEPAAWVFAGVRKLTHCEDPEKRPGDGTELSYTTMQLDSMHALADLLDGKAAEVELIDLAHVPQEQNGRTAVKQH
jgi:hypothetical protein